MSAMSCGYVQALPLSSRTWECGYCWILHSSAVGALSLCRSLIIEPRFGSGSSCSPRSTRSLPSPLICWLIPHIADRPVQTAEGCQREKKQCSWEAWRGQVQQHRSLAVLFFMSKGQELRGYRHPHTNILVCKQIFLCVGVCNHSTHTQTSKQRERGEREHRAYFVFSMPWALDILGATEILPSGIRS